MPKLKEAEEVARSRQSSVADERYQVVSFFKRSLTSSRFAKRIATMSPPLGDKRLEFRQGVQQGMEPSGLNSTDHLGSGPGQLPARVDPQRTASSADAATATPQPKPSGLRPIPVAGGVDPVTAIGTAAIRSAQRDELGLDAHTIARFAPPWAFSFVWHLLLIVLLGLLFFPTRKPPVFELDAVFSESIGEQLEDDVAISTPLETDLEESLVFEDEWQPVEAPLAAVPTIEVPSEMLQAAVSMSVPTIGIALNGRETGMRKALLRAYGGTAETELAVKNGLEWLKRRQQMRGQWSLIGPYSQGGGSENTVAATGMALLAFQGAGHTTKQGEYRDEVKRGWGYLMPQQDKQGCFFERNNASNHRFYTHAIATIALCELYAMTGDATLEEPAQNAVDYLCVTQDRLGGWRYIPGEGSDLSVTGWVLMALQSARMAGLTVPSPVLEKIAKYLDMVQEDNGSRYGYQLRTGSTESMTAEGLLCRQYLGWERERPAMQAGASYLVDNPIEWRNPDLYYWYYATQVLHHMEGDHWNQWNSTLRTEIPAKQETVGDERGSWYHGRDSFSRYGGRLYSTCLCIYMLEVYYRHLPIYAKVYE